MVWGFFRRGAQAGSKSSKVTKIGSTGFLANRRLKNIASANLGTGVSGYSKSIKMISKSGDNLDDAFSGIKGIKKGAGGKGYIVPKGYAVVDDAGKVMGRGGSSFGASSKASKTWNTTYRVVKVTDKITDANKTAKIVGVLGKAKQIGKAVPIPGIGKTFRIGFLVTAGYGFYRIISITGAVSDKAEEVINNFYGIDCEDGDVACEERGAKNMILSGVLGIAVVGGLLYMSLKPKGKEDKQEVEIKISKDEAVTTA